jgi:hypothetical protein
MTIYQVIISNHGTAYDGASESDAFNKFEEHRALTDMPESLLFGEVVIFTNSDGYYEEYEGGNK